jgi:hypothetical protein
VHRSGAGIVELPADLVDDAAGRVVAGELVRRPAESNEYLPPEFTECSPIVRVAGRTI